jgi:hypothetical protein
MMFIIKDAPKFGTFKKWPSGAMGFFKLAAVEPNNISNAKLAKTPGE